MEPAAIARAAVIGNQQQVATTMAQVAVKMEQQAAQTLVAMLEQAASATPAPTAPGVGTRIDRSV